MEELERDRRVININTEGFFLFFFGGLSLYSQVYEHYALNHLPLTYRGLRLAIYIKHPFPRLHDNNSVSQSSTHAIAHEYLKFNPMDQVHVYYEYWLAMSSTPYLALHVAHEQANECCTLDMQ